MEFCLYLYIVCFILLQNYNLYGLVQQPQKATLKLQQHH